MCINTVQRTICVEEKLSLLFLLCVWMTLPYFGHCCVIFHVNCLHIHNICLNIGYNSSMWTSSTCLIPSKQIGPWICVIRPRDLGLEPEPAAFWFYNCLVDYIFISHFILAWLNFGFDMDRHLVWVSPEAICSAREREREREKEGEEKRGKERDNKRGKEIEILTSFVWLSVNLWKHIDKTENKNDWDIAKTLPWR